MHFKYPDLLYALFFLLIPVLVHLFQLRSFRKEEFTNVKFLKKAVSETRKSAQLKKWLILFNRLVLLACIIIAFAQPYLPPAVSDSKGQETIVYLDNSLSMQAKGSNGILLKQGIQQLISSIPEEESIFFFTNDSDLGRLDSGSFRKKLQEINYSPNQLDWKTVRLKAEGLSNKDPGASANFIAISDFQQHDEKDLLVPVQDMSNHLVPMLSEGIRNISLDSVFISSKNANELILTAILKTSGNLKEEISVSVFDGINLLSRKTISVGKNDATEVKFNLPAGPVKKGRLNIGDNSLSFDNELFFSINPAEAVNVVSIGIEKSEFLSRIFSTPEFRFTSFSEGNVDFNALSEANVIILNEPEIISGPLRSQLQKLHSEKVLVAIIPSTEADVETYNQLLTELGMPVFTKKVHQEQLITEITFTHPLYRPVFDKEVRNFHYPAVQTYFKTLTEARPVLKFNNGASFLMEKAGVYLFSAPVNVENSNFQGSPLIVPTFYNMGNLAVSPGQLYYNLGEEQMINLPVSLQQDEILRLVSKDFYFIPRQKKYQNKIQLLLERDITTAGHYVVMKDTVAVKTLALNFPREESRLRYRDLQASEGFKIHQSIPAVFSDIQSSQEEAALWKWFVIFAFIFLLTEMLILKYFK